MSKRINIPHDESVVFIQRFGMGRVNQFVVIEYRSHIRTVLDNHLWRTLKNSNGDTFKTFGDFMEAELPEGAETRLEFVEQLCSQTPALLSKIKDAWGMQDREDAARSQIDAIMSRFGWQFVMSHLVKRCTATPLRGFLRGK
ncbi:hypothetical protein ACFOOP_14220 [Marinicaulis aureus]|uniref:Uncharacterized protein n=1 Tax=Hyphococcus aureus TaxID=2666033 RepID=A0ABW1L0P7_9PROT